jgi:hypothetical protein
MFSAIKIVSSNLIGEKGLGLKFREEKVSFTLG